MPVQCPNTLPHSLEFKVENNDNENSLKYSGKIAYVHQSFNVSNNKKKLTC